MKKKVIGILMASLMAFSLLAGCGNAAKTDSSSSDSSSKSASADSNSVNLISEDKMNAAPAAGDDFSKLKIGEIESYVINDGGWCQATHTSIVSAMSALGIPESNLVVLESIDDSDQAMTESAAEELIDDGCNLIICASTGYSSFLPDVAKKNPKVTFAQWGNKVNNMVGYEIRSYEGMFLAGYASELLSKDANPQLGYSASMDEFSVRTAINAYALGAKYANKDATVKVAWANSWYDIDKETQCAQSLIDAGIKYMGMEASSPAIPETCEKNHAYVVGYHNDMSTLAPDAVLVSYEWNFAPIFKQIMISAAEGTATANDFYYWGGECAKLSDFASFVPTDVVSQVKDLKAKLDSGEVKVYSGELKSNKGETLVPAGSVMSDDDILKQEFLVDNVLSN